MPEKKDKKSPNRIEVQATCCYLKVIKCDAEIGKTSIGVESIAEAEMILLLKQNALNRLDITVCICVFIKIQCRSGRVMHEFSQPFLECNIENPQGFILLIG